MKNFKTLLLGLSFFAVAIIAKANSEKPDALLHGYVTDAVTRKPVSGVVVSVTVPGVNGSKEATTDADGYFSFEQLPGMQINLQFGKKGYQVYKRSNIAVKEKTPIKISVEFLPENNEQSDEGDHPLLRVLQME